MTLMLVPWLFVLILVLLFAFQGGQILRLDLQPAYQSGDDRTYGMTIGGWNIRWRSGPEGRREVCEVTRTG